jgi:4-amino-4-deoxy-L-arabinose transferase-like glycosyltransferase
MVAERRDMASLALVFAVALALRLVPVLLTMDMGIALDDMFQYDALAESIRLQQGYTWYGGIPTAFRAPLYPLFLAAIYTLFGHQFVAARLAQAVVGAIVPLVVYVLGQRLFDRRVARASAWVVACFPMFLVYPLALTTETLFFLLVPLAVFCLIKAVDTSRRPYYLLAGLLLGLCILTRSVIAGFVVLVLPWLWYYLPSKREAVKNWGLVLLPVAALTIPWSLRNSLLLGQFVFVESSLGFNFYLGFHPDNTGTFDSAIAVDFLEEIGGFDTPGLMTEKLAHNLGMERGLAFIRADPARAAWLLVSKASHFLRLDTRAALYFYSNDFLGELPSLVLLLLLLTICLPWVAVLLLSVTGTCFSKATSDKTLVYALSVYFLGVHMAIMAEPRFHLVLVPFLAIFAAQGGRILRHARGFLQAPGARWRLVACALLVALLVLNWMYQLNVDADKLKLVFSPGGNTARFTY